MNITIGATSFDVEIDAYRPNFESGIQWRCIGGVWRAIDNGINCDHYSTTITVSGDYEDIHALRDAIVANIAQGGNITVNCTTAEKIFGHQFTYSSSYICLVASDDDPLDSIAPDGNLLAAWRLTLYPLTDMTARFAYTPVNFPSNVMTTKVSRRNIPHATESVLYNGFAQTGFNVDEPTCTLKYYGTSQQIGEAISWLIGKRTTKFSVTSPSGVFYFNNGVQTQDVYFFDLTDSGNVDQSSLEGEITVTYLLA